MNDKVAAPAVLHVETGRHLYGGALQVLYLLQGLAERGCSNVLVCPEDSAIADAARDIVRVRPVRAGGDLDLRLPFRLRRIAREERPDLIHLHSRRGADVLGGIAGRLAGLPVVLSRRVDNPEARGWVRWKYRLFDAVIAISTGIRDLLEAEGVPAEKIRCVPSAVDTDRYRPGSDRARLAAEFDLPEGSPAVGMVAQFIPRKGHHCLLDSIPAILEKHPGARFLLFGRGPLEDEIRTRIDRGDLTASVQLAGFRDDLDRLLPGLDLLVHPAEMEGLGVALLQAAACGVPVVATTAGGIPDIVRDGVNGILVPPRDSRALASAVSLLLSDPSRARAFGKAGRSIAETDFSIAGMVEGNLEVYRSVLAARR
jgi:glycosyltransferase involved in cell wall biosynthesis